MNLIFQFLSLLWMGWTSWLIVRYIREDWQKYPENPTKIFLAKYFAGIVFISLLFLWIPLSQNLMNDKGEIVFRMLTVPAGINKVERGQFVIYSDFNKKTRARRVIALPNDELSVVDGIIYISMEYNLAQHLILFCLSIQTVTQWLFHPYSTQTFRDYSLVRKRTILLR